MGEIKFAGAFGYRANGTTIQQVCVVTDGEQSTVHLVDYNKKSQTIPGVMVDDFDPNKERLFTYSQVRRALQKAKTNERLFGTMALFGASDVTRFGRELGRMTPITVQSWIEKLAFDGIDPEAVYAQLIETYKEVNLD